MYFFVKSKSKLYRSYFIKFIPLASTLFGCRCSQFTTNLTQNINKIILCLLFAPNIFKCGCNFHFRISNEKLKKKCCCLLVDRYLYFTRFVVFYIRSNDDPRVNDFEDNGVLVFFRKKFHILIRMLKQKSLINCSLSDTTNY